MPADREAHHAPDHALAELVDREGGQVRIAEGEAGDVAVDHEALAAHLAFDRRDDDAAVARLEAAIDAGEVAAVDAGPFHRRATDPPQEGGGRVRHEPAGQFERAFQEVIGGGREAGAQGLPDQRDADGVRAVDQQLIDLVN